MEALLFLVRIFYFYLLCGVVFAVVFLWRGAATLDKSADGISWKTRLLLFPGTTALWPVLLGKWLRVYRKT